MRAMKWKNILLLTVMILVGINGCKKIEDKQQISKSVASVQKRQVKTLKNLDLRDNETVLLIGDDTLIVELAVTPMQRAMGLMFRDSLAENHGMLFVFEEPARHAFWMRNTTIPLSIAFIDENGVILEIQDMQPLTEDLHAPQQPVTYALEVNQGWFERHGVQIGDTVKFLMFP